MSESTLFAFVCENLPEDWRIEIHMAHGCLDAVLYDPDDEEVKEPFVDESPHINMMVRNRVNYALSSDGLEVVI